MESQQYFGIPLSNIEAAQSHAVVGRFRLNVFVPTRKDVASLPPAELTRVLIDWMNRSATEIIPSKAQIQEVLKLLRTRADFNKLKKVSEMCSNYISGE